MSYRTQNIVPIEPEDLIEKVVELKNGGYRLGQICSTRIENGNELLYSFDKDHDLLNLKMAVPDGKEIQSITKIYWPAFIYENEAHDLFGVKFLDSELDYGGKFFKLSRPTPWVPETKELE